MGNGSVIGGDGNQTSGFSAKCGNEIGKKRNRVISRKRKFRIVKLKNRSKERFPRIVKWIQGRSGRAIDNMKIVIRISIPHNTNKVRWTGLEHLIGTIEIVKSIANGGRGHRRTRKRGGTMSPRARQDASERQFFPALTSTTNQNRHSLQKKGAELAKEEMSE